MTASNQHNLSAVTHGGLTSYMNSPHETADDQVHWLVNLIMPGMAAVLEILGKRGHLIYVLADHEQVVQMWEEGGERTPWYAPPRVALLEPL